MQQSKSSKIINQARSSIYTFTEISPLSLNPEDRKLNQIRKRSKQSEIPEKSPKDSHKTPAKSISGLKSLKIPQRKTDKIENSISKEKRLKDLSPVISPKESFKKPLVKTSISPKMFRNLSPLSETLPESTVIKGSNLGKKEKNEFRHLNIAKELELNQKILNIPHKFKSKSCLENIVLLSESKELTHFTFIEENLKICTGILRDVMGRLEEIGKSNEAVLLDKFWRHVVETVDQTIDAFMNNSRKNESMINGRFDSIIHHKTQDFESLIRGQDFELESFKFNEKSQAGELPDVTGLIVRVQEEIQKLTDLCRKGEEFHGVDEEMRLCSNFGESGQVLNELNSHI